MHTDRVIRPQDAMLSLWALFDFVDWIDYCYGLDYTERSFDERKIPSAGIPLTRRQAEAIKGREALLVERDETIRELEEQVRSMSDELTAARQQNSQERAFNPDEVSEFETRKLYIDTDPKLAGWDFEQYVVGERGVPTYFSRASSGLPTTTAGPLTTCRSAAWCARW